MRDKNREDSAYYLLHRAWRPPRLLALLVALLSGVAMAKPVLTNEIADLREQVLKYYRQGHYSEALPLAKQLAGLTEATYGSEHPDTATRLDELALVYARMADYRNAEPLFQRSLHIREKVLGLEHPDTAKSLSNLAMLYDAAGDYGKAEPLFQRSLNVREKVLGPEHPSTATSLNNLAGLYHTMGDYGKAEPLFQRCLKIFESASGSENPYTATALNNLAALYYEMGDYGKAEPLLHRCLKISEQALGPEHPDTAKALNNLAKVYTCEGDYGGAEPLLQRGVKVLENILGREHPDTASLLDSLALLYDTMTDYGKAEALFQRCLKIRENALGPEHPDTATSLHNLASLYRRMGDYEKSEPLCQRTLEIREKVLGAVHPDTVRSMYNLAWLYQSMGERTKALLAAERATSVYESMLGRLLSFTSDRQRTAYVRCQNPYDLLATLGCAPGLAEALLRNRGIVLDSLMEDELAAKESSNPEVKKSLEDLRSAGRRLIKLQMETPSDLSPEALRQRQTEKDTFEQQVDTFQKALARNVGSLGRTRRALRVTVPEVRAVLAKDEVLLEFIRYSHYLGKAQSEARYGVVLIGSVRATVGGKKAGGPVWVPLGSAESIERNLKEYGGVMRGERRGELSLLRTLHAQLFEPIQKMLPKGITTLVISPDAELNFMSFATLVNEQDRFLAEQYTIKYVASGRDLIFGRAGKKGSRRLAAFANPAFGEKPAVASASDTNVVHLAMMATDQRDYAGLTLAPLPNTLQEAEFLRERSSAWNMQGVMYAGAEATEAELKAVKSPYILHLATHGFFLPDTLPTNQPTMDTRLLGQERMPMVWHNPMQRSGLAFAGAQLTLDAWKRGETPDPEDDGILMAQEVGTMNLKETWLVVLSACDTGVGEARAGEGVLGLRRGFIQAGAQNLLMTLWPVSDKWTVEMMKAFYDRALKNGDASGALAQVQRDYLVKLRKEKNPVMAARLAGPFVMTFQGGVGEKE